MSKGERLAPVDHDAIDYHSFRKVRSPTDAVHATKTTGPL